MFWGLTESREHRARKRSVAEELRGPIPEDGRQAMLSRIMTDGRKEIIGGAVEGGATAGAAVIATMATVGAVGAAALAAGPTLLAAGVGVALECRKRAAERFWHELVLAESKVEPAVTLMAGNHQQVAKDEWIEVPWRVRMLRDEYVGKKDGKDEERYAYLTGLKAPDRLFYLLRLNGLASETRGVSFVAGPTTIVVERVTVERLHAATRLSL